MTGARRVVVVRAGTAGRAATTELQAAGIGDFVVLDRDVVSCVFDDTTDTWALRTSSGDVVEGDVVIACHRAPFLAWVPELAGRNDFRGVSFHAAQWDAGFDPTGKRVAVIGVDAGAGHHIARLAGSAASVTVFAHARRRVVAELPLVTTRAARWLRRRVRPVAGPGVSRLPTVVASPVEAITPSGIRTVDGVEHRVDAIIYGTGFAIPDHLPDDALVGAGGVSIREAWYDGMEPYFGVAVHGMPNYFFVTGPDVGAQARHIAECVQHLAQSASGRIEVRRSSQQVFNERACLKTAPPPCVTSAFDLSSAGADSKTYDGAATLTIGGTQHPVRVRLTGHLDPIDGQYHWQGTVFSSPTQPLTADAYRRERTATLTVGRLSAPARITEQTPWGSHSVAGVGAPPYALTEG